MNQKKRRERKGMPKVLDLRGAWQGTWLIRTAPWTEKELWENSVRSNHVCSPVISKSIEFILHYPLNVTSKRILVYTDKQFYRGASVSQCCVWCIEIRLGDFVIWTMHPVYSKKAVESVVSSRCGLNLEKHFGRN